MECWLDYFFVVVVLSQEDAAHSWRSVRTHPADVGGEQSAQGQTGLSLLERHHHGADPGSPGGEEEGDEEDVEAGLSLHL